MENIADIQKNLSEPQKKRGFGCWCAALIRWIFILLFAVILLGWLYFRVPWKILVLDGVLLSLLTVVPKQKRKYGWLALAIAVLAVAVWIFIPEKDSGDWKPYSFNEEIKAYNAKYAVPDEENAAIIYDRLFQLILQNCASDENKNYESPFYPSYQRLDKDKVEDWLKSNQQVVFDSLKAASQKDKCFWLMNSEGDTVNYTEMSALKYVMYFVVEEISQNIKNHQNQPAIEKLLWGFSCARHLKQQADTTYLLVGNAIEGMYNIAFYKVIVQLELTESQLSEMLTLSDFITHDWGAFSERFSEYVVLRNKIKFTSIIYEINSENNTRFSGNVMGVGISMLDNWYMLPFMSSDIENEYWRERGSKIARVINWWYVPSSPADFIAMFDEHAYFYPLMDTSIHTQSFFPEISWKTTMFNCNYLVKLNVLLQVDAIYNIPIIDSRIQSGQIAGHILLAMKQYHNQHNQWPESLSLLTTIQPGLQLADPLNNGEYVYNVANDEFRLYSKGLNGVDEGGEYYQNADDLLIWPRELEDSD